jgi:Spy/CpxP family protein refolding chaperone
MENEWLDIACINHEKYIMHGQIDNGIVDGFCQTVQIEQVLTPEQRREVEDLSFKHERELRALLKGFVND